MQTNLLVVKETQKLTLQKSLEKYMWNFLISASVSVKHLLHRVIGIMPISEVCVLLGKRTCDEGWFECKYVFGCVPQSRVQDGKPDCYDKSDEDNQSMKLLLVNKWRS